MERIATDIYTFSKLRNEGFTYVDKTDELYAMASGEAGKQFFISRPRRFGKSLAVSTLRCLFEGKHELFRGLAIEPEWDWSKESTSVQRTKKAVISPRKSYSARTSLGLCSSISRI